MQNSIEKTAANNTKLLYSYDKYGKIKGEITEENIYTYTRGTELIGYTSNSGDRLYYVQDGHGNVTALLNEDGTERKTYTYNPYGKEEDTIIYPMGSKTAIMLWRLQVETPHNPFRYCGEYYDDETDLIYLRNRYYDNQTGRFITEDPIKDSLNWYSYCDNDPINNIDPWGLYYLEKDENGQVYAAIEAGDTLSRIASSEVGDAKAWKKMNYSGDPSKIQVGQRINISSIYNKSYPISVALSNSLPLSGKPNSTGRLYNPDGSLKQERQYGSNGQPVKDTDYSHGGAKHEFPHEHEWKDGKRGPAQPVPEKKSSNPSETVKKAGVWMGVGATIYWIISEGSRILFPLRNLVPVP